MAKSTKVSFSREHVGRKSGKSEVDIHRRQSDSSKNPKIGHSTLNPGYGKTPVDVKINKK